MKKINRESLTLEQVMNYRQWLIDSFRDPKTHRMKDEAAIRELKWCSVKEQELILAKERQELLDDWYWAFEDEE